MSSYFDFGIFFFVTLLTPILIYLYTYLIICSHQITLLKKQWHYKINSLSILLNGHSTGSAENDNIVVQIRVYVFLV